MADSDNKATRSGISSHFRREARIMAWFLPALMLLGLIAGLIGPWLLGYLRGS